MRGRTKNNIVFPRQECTFEEASIDRDDQRKVFGFRRPAKVGSFNGRTHLWQRFACWRHGPTRTLKMNGARAPMTGRMDMNLLDASLCFNSWRSSRAWPGSAAGNRRAAGPPIYQRD